MPQQMAHIAHRQQSAGVHTGSSTTTTGLDGCCVTIIGLKPAAGGWWLPCVVSYGGGGPTA